MNEGEVGLKHYFDLFCMPQFKRLFRNTFVVSFISLITGALYVFLGSMAIAGTKNKILKGLFTAIFCFPIIIPQQLVICGMENISYKIFFENGFLLQFFIGALEGIKYSPFAIIAALFIKGNTVRKSIYVSLLFVAIRLMIFFTNDLGTILSIYNPATYETADVFSSFAYRRGLGGEGGSNPWSFAATVSMTITFLQIFTAAGACIILMKLTKNRDSVPEVIKEPTSASSLWYISLCIPVILFLISSIYGGTFFGDILYEKKIPLLEQRYYNGFIYAVMSAILVSVGAMGIAKLSSNAGVIGVICITIMCTTLTEMHMTRYLIMEHYKLDDTFFAPIYLNLKLIPIVAVVYTFIIKENRSSLVDLSVVIIGAMLVFAWVWGDYTAPLIGLRKERELWNVSLVFRSVLSSEGEIPFGLMKYILIPVHISIGLAILSGKILPAADKLSRKEK